MESCKNTVMEKSTHSSHNNNNINNQSGHFLKQLNTSSHKITKTHHHQRPHNSTHNANSTNNNNYSSSNNNSSSSNSSNNSSNQQQQQQPPVYNINKNEFRDVVQKLTGSPAHDSLSMPPPIHPPKPQSSRLQRIRPPPLAHVGPRPPSTPLVPPPNDGIGIGSGIGIYGARPRSPFSPLPPLPTVSAAAESPISAYMRYLQNSITGSSGDTRFSGWSPNPSVLPQFPLMSPPPPMNSLPPAFGHVPSPRSACPLLSPSLLFSPTAQLGFPPMPLSPGLPVPSPTWKDM